MKFLVNKNGTPDWIEVDAISGEDAIFTQYKEQTLYHSSREDIQIFDNFEGTQLYAVKEVKNGH